MRTLIISCVLYAVVHCDIFLSNPRGSNNRLNEDSAQRDNANRMYDSQDNNRGGYNVGDRTDEAATTAEGQYPMKYFQSDSSSSGPSILSVEWVNQHGCGSDDTDPAKQNCNLVLQYMCENAEDFPLNNVEAMRDGTDTDTPTYTKPSKDETIAERTARRTGDIDDLTRGQQESWDNYDKCYLRDNNKGLFVADQNLKDNKFGYTSASYTRQNANGNRYGYECAEERDYYPYWHPTPWKDIIVFSESDERCTFYQENSFNVQPYHECVELVGGVYTGYSRYNNEAECTSNGGTWTLFYNYLELAKDFTTEAACKEANIDFAASGHTFIWEVPSGTSTPQTKECLVELVAPACEKAPWTRNNHLGNAREAEPLNYTWTIPHFPSEKAQRCVLRMRYNISTDDYDPYNTDSNSNQDTSAYIESPVTNDPYIDVGASNSPIRLAINTAQFGRTFQDRTHIFFLEPRPEALKGGKIFNLNVRGKRGNIVQAFPAVEYDFFPTHMNINQADKVHIQWTGSNTHDNDNPAGDGQAGDAGQGADGTDRHNFVEMVDLNLNYPTPYEKQSMIPDGEVVWVAHGNTGLSNRDHAINLATSGYYQCARDADCGAESFDTKEELNAELDNAPASYEGMVLKFTAGQYFFMCTRNNAFTNRSQKGSLNVST